MPTDEQEFAAVVLTGGGGARLGGADKAGIEVGGQTLLERSLAAVADAAEVVVVGDEVPTSRPVTFTREDPAGGGPAAGLLAGLARLSRTPARVVALAVDMPLVTRDTVRRLLAAASSDGAGDGAGDGAVLIDAEGRAQYLCAAYRVDALHRAHRASGSDTGHGLAMRALVAPLRLAEVPSEPDEAQDLDTWADLAALRRHLGG